MTDVQLFRIQLIAIVGSLALLVVIIDMLRKRRLREEYSLLWLLGAAGFLVLAVFRDLLTQLSFAVGIAYPPAALFLFLIMGAYLMLLHFSLVFSRQTEKLKSLTQEVALLKLEIERMNSEKAASERLGR